MPKFTMDYYGSKGQNFPGAFCISKEIITLVISIFSMLTSGKIFSKEFGPISNINYFYSKKLLRQQIVLPLHTGSHY